MSLAQIIAARRAALLQDFIHNSVPPLLQVESRDALGELTFLEEFEQDEEEMQLGRRRPDSVVIRQKPGQSGAEATLWVAADYGGYRSAYLAFIRKAYDDNTVRKSELVGYDVDHLLNRARSAAGSAYLRIEAIPSSINQRWGSVFERAASSDLIAKNRSGRRLMSYLVAAKVAGLSPPDGPDDLGRINAIAGYFQGMGLDRAEVVDGIRNMWRHVARNQA